ncbi:phage baseplate assembly protein V [Lelliottia amnigena]|uniref:phage baseplate assembly protein V n=1 Tax=Lelliottia amnigena TaxID=61646 RepID=UPI00192CD94C|nr:phage baseplate assembly protein V [Lelliottia amnigena]MBL5919771.1 phage baseplate assembly protein V [Lelliottia amnigena]
MADYETSVLAQQIARLIRFGTVHSVQASPPRCRVSFGIDPVTNTEHKTGWLSWSAMVDDTASEWRMPAVGASVMVLSPGGNTTGGLVFPAGYTDDRTPPSEEPGQHVTRYSDGAIVSYDTQAHSMAVSLPDGGTVKIIGPGGITLDGPVTITKTLTVDETAEVKGNLSSGGDISAQGDIADQGDSSSSMAKIREIYNDHDHEYDDGTTKKPNQPL